jgi:hypothetical protein
MRLWIMQVKTIPSIIIIIIIIIMYIRIYFKMLSIITHKW